MKFPKPRPYHLLLLRDEAGQPFYIQFGDYDHAVVKQEFQDHIQSGFKAKDMAIRTAEQDTQIACDLVVTNYNKAIYGADFHG